MAHQMQIDDQTTTLDVCKQYDPKLVGDVYAEYQWFTKEIMRYVTHYKESTDKKECYKWLQKANCNCWNNSYALRYIQSVKSIINNKEYDATKLGQFKQKILSTILYIQRISTSKINNNNSNNNNNDNVDTSIQDKSYSTVQRPAEKIAPLDALSLFPVLNKHLNGLKIGECVRSIMEIQTTYKKISLKKTLKVLNVNKSC